MFERNEAHDKINSPVEMSLEVVLQPLQELESPHHTIHLLDHDSEVLIALFDFLSNAGFKVSASSNADDALDYVARTAPEILIANMEMPEMSGADLLHRVRDLTPTTKVILTSARVDWSAYEDILRSGGSDLVTKPIKGMAILRAVERVLSK